jgi:hypothetical protein
MFFEKNLKKNFIPLVLSVIFLKKNFRFLKKCRFAAMKILKSGVFREK